MKGSRSTGASPEATALTIRTQPLQLGVRRSSRTKGEAPDARMALCAQEDDGCVLVMSSLCFATASLLIFLGGEWRLPA